MYNSETTKKVTSPGDSGIRSAPLFIIRPWSLRLHCRKGDFAMTPGQADAGDFDSDIQILPEEWARHKESVFRPR